ncbi:SDR family NAD(P)-dependent oxidoreductase [Streptomyces sp. BSE7-9]|uniref:SDR family NAD(P)-dependent oxidoreductase n=1 Tax=Streptomyces sp. BSE7-9 TaxID=2759948 RepID=UPI0027DCE812|nr:SDR family NAD(P)-dependent oxidoreductase [Streptomyces sp. BSE7-9]
MIVTGAAGTFGRALGARFTELGARAVGLDLHADASAPVPVVGCDLTAPESVTKGVEEAVRLLAGGGDVLVNSAGRGGPAPPELRGRDDRLPEHGAQPDPRQHEAGLSPEGCRGRSRWRAWCRRWSPR